MSVVLLARHGQATFGMGTYEQLSDQGRAQMRHLGEVLLSRGVEVERILCGELERQRESAEVLAAVLGGPAVSIVPDWDEYDHMPLIARVKPSYRKHWLMVADLARTGNPSRRLQELIDEALVGWVEPDAGEPASDAVETFASYSRRAEAALAEAASQGGTTVVVSSAGTISAAVAPLVGITPQAWPTLHRVMVNSSLTKVVRGQRGLSLVSFNEHGHLEGVPGLKITYR